MSRLPNSITSINIIFEDENIAVVDKPAGMPCYPNVIDEIKDKLSPSPHPSPPPKDRRASTRGEGDHTHIPFPLMGEGEGGGDLVHRLDNDTSGLLIVAKTKKAFENLRRQFDERKVLKQYTALVLGETPSEGVIVTPIIHDPKSKKRMKVIRTGSSLRACREDDIKFSTSPRSTGLRSNGKAQQAWTNYKLLKKYLGGRYSLIKVIIKTGVRHQIRVHLASIGHPIAGDRLYQNTRQKRRDETGLKRQFLHASKIGFTATLSPPSPPPDNRRAGIKGEGVKWMEFESPLPYDLRNVLTKMENV